MAALEYQEVRTAAAFFLKMFPGNKPCNPTSDSLSQNLHGFWARLAPQLLFLMRRFRENDLEGLENAFAL